MSHPRPPPSDDSLDTSECEQVINWDQLISRLEDEELIRKVVPLFPVDNKERIKTLAEAIEAGDAKRIASCAHAIKGAAVNIGAKRLSEIAGYLEVAGHKDNTAAAPQIFDELENEFERVASFVSQPDWCEIARDKTDLKQS